MKCSGCYPTRPTVAACLEISDDDDDGDASTALECIENIEMNLSSLRSL